MFHDVAQPPTELPTTLLITEMVEVKYYSILALKTDALPVNLKLLPASHSQTSCSKTTGKLDPCISEARAMLHRRGS